MDLTEQREEANLSQNVKIFSICTITNIRECAKETLKGDFYSKPRGDCPD